MRLIRLAVVAIAALAFGGLAIGGLAAPSATASTPPAAAQLSPARDATEASRAARELRTETLAMIQRYIDDYGDRVSAADVARLEQYRVAAQRNLTTLVVTSRRLAALVAQDAPRRDVVAAGRAAQRAHANARVVADRSYNQARAILEPRLSWLEGLRALVDYDEMMGRFNALGTRLDAVVRSYPAA